MLHASSYFGAGGLLAGEDAIFTTPLHEEPRNLGSLLADCPFVRVTVEDERFQLRLVDDHGYWPRPGKMLVRKLYRSGEEVLDERQMIISQDVALSGIEAYMIQRFVWAGISWAPEQQAIYRKDDDSLLSSISVCETRAG